MDGADEIPAKDFVQMYKGTRDLYHAAEAARFDENIDNAKRNDFKEKADSLKTKLKEQKEILENQLPKEFSETLAGIDKRYKDEVIPFYKNKIYQNVKYKGHTGDNIIKDTRGIYPHNKIMQEAIRLNPELNALALGQKFADKPHEMAASDALYKPYIKAHAPSQSFLREHAAAESQHTAAQNALNEAQETLKQKQGEQTAAEKEYLKQVKETQQQEQQLTSKIDKLEQDLQQNEQFLQQLREDIQKEGLTKENLQRQKDLQKKRNVIKSKVWDIGRSSAGYSGAKVIGKIMKLLMGS